MPRCVVKSCPNWRKDSRDPDAKYFKFPENNLEVLDKWKQFCNITHYNSKKTRICSLHFGTDSFEDKPLHCSSAGECFSQLKSSAVPTNNSSSTASESWKNKRKTLTGSVSSNENPTKKFREDSLRSEQFSNGVQKHLSCQKSLQSVEQRYTNPDFHKEKLDTIAPTEIKHLSDENEALKKEIVKLKEIISSKERFVESKIRKRVFEILAPVLHIRDIRNFLHPDEELPHWKKEDLVAAVNLRCILPKNHKNHSYINNTKLVTYKKEIAEFILKPGVIMELLPHLDERHKDFLQHEKLGFLNLQEIDISTNLLCQEKILYGTLHGLFRKWKNLTYFNYHQPYSAEIISEIVEKVQIVNHVVTAIFINFSSSHLWSTFNIGITDDKKRYFPHPIYENLKVFAFVDPFELIKELRNYFLDFGFRFKDQILDKQCLEELLMLDASEVKAPNVLEQKHLDVTGVDRHGLGPVLQIFSNTTSECIRWCGSNGLLASEYWSECADFIETASKWFDLFNINNKHEKKTSGVYGSDIKLQNEVLDKMSFYMANIRIENHLNPLPVQKSIILNNLSLKEFLLYIQNQYNTKNNKIETVSFSFN